MSIDFFFGGTLLALGAAGLLGLRGLGNARTRAPLAVAAVLLLATPLTALCWWQLAAGVALTPVLCGGVTGLWPSGAGALAPLGLPADGFLGNFLLAAVLPALAFLLLVLTRPQVVVAAALRGLSVLVLAGTLFVLTHSLVVLVLSFELLLLAAIYLLQLTSKSERVLEAALEMFLWTLAGSACLLPGLLFFFVQGGTELGVAAAVGGADLLPALLLLLGFGVKVPLWPCFSWLLRAHVEASVEFSILLSGLIVKFGALGLARALSFLGATPAAYLLAGLALAGMWEATWRLFGQRDLKRIVALTTIIEMNWLTLSLALGGLALEQLFMFIAVAHSLTTVTEFYLAECLSRRYGTRDVTRLGGLYQAAPGLWAASLCGVLVTIGFPGTSLFAAKLHFLVQVCGLSLALGALSLVLFMLILPLFFIRLWVPIWFGHGRHSSAAAASLPELTGRELFLLSCSLGGSLVLGVWPALGLGLG